ncbi:cytochrome P450 [Streptomyces sp. NPDC048659]|uniref:cytochrome P450 n=1 Tax=Streptomyces sp. NPDC048659 TaxID=3155489 RepID=UPI00341F7380
MSPSSRSATTAAVPGPAPAPEAAPESAPEGGVVGLLREAAQAGPVTPLRIGDRSFVLATGPEQMLQILARRPEVYVKHGHRARPLLGDGLISASGEAWQRQRRLLQGQFTVTGTRRWAHHIAGAAERIADRWAAAHAGGAQVDIGRDMRFFALDTIWRALTGTALDEATERELEAVDTVVASLPTLAGGAPDPALAVDEALQAIDTTAHRVIALARERRAGAARGTGHEAAHGAAPGGQPHLLDLLLDTAETRTEYTDRLIRDELVTLLVAGHETTAQTLCWLFVLLDRHPEAHDRFLAAHASAAGPAERDAQLNALVQEALRLYPAVWLVPRHAARDDVLDGVAITAGTGVLVCPYLTHRIPELWPDPEHFAPERFLPGGRRPQHPAAFQPFGVGARACLGQHFALQETLALLRLLLPAYRPVLADPPRGAVFGANLRPDGPVRGTLTALRP